jgi:hypothetical protein
MPLVERPFTLLVAGRPILSFVASTFNEANEITREEWLRADLLKYRSNGQALWMATQSYQSGHPMLRKKSGS